MSIRWHEEAPEELLESIRFTSEETGLAPSLIEKDYYCSVILEALNESHNPLIFKGGTCLAKVHSGFFRLSEDLDFSIPTEPDASPSDRRGAIAPVKVTIGTIPDKVQGLEIRSPLEGHNKSTQYNAILGYRSLLSSRTESIRVEIGLREPTLTTPVSAPINTVLLHWTHGDALLKTFSANCLSYEETMAEKLRAALTREEVAIRDFFDIDHAVGREQIDVTNAEIVRLVRAKLAVGGTGPVDVSELRLDTLRHQLSTDLRPVLRTQEFALFDLDRAFGIVRRVAESLK